MINIGCHLSISKGFEHIAKEAISINANTFQFFTRNPQGGKARELNLSDIKKYNILANENNFSKIVAHAPYTLNPCSNNPQTREFAELVFIDDIKRMEHIPNNYYNFHPGSHVGQGINAGIEMIVNLLNKIIKHNQSTMLLLETMSGKGSEVGSKFEELSSIISQIEIKEKIGICLDTCHIYAAGYDIVNNLDDVINQFDKIIGLNNLKAIHLNDSLMPLGSHKDRHAKIGEGEIGSRALIQFINHPAIKNLPIILETPNDLIGYANEIEFLHKNS